MPKRRLYIVIISVELKGKMWLKIQLPALFAHLKTWDEM